MSGDKAPGPDGFNMEFFKHCWDIVSRDFMEVIKELQDKRCMEYSLNSTFVALIPKKTGADRIEDLRPISLVSSVYKIISKVLASRLKKVLPSLIGEEQGAFVKGRQILDGVLIANECLDSRIKNKEGGMIGKIDLQKAYDHVNWDFLEYMMGRMGFGERWISWIMKCVTTVSFSILVNGSPAGFFRGSRGLRQGDPLSPFLFLIIAEALGRLFTRAVDIGKLSGFRVKDGPLISHLQFADDTLVFLEHSRDQVRALRVLLCCFEAMSGLHINLHKSKLYGVGEETDIHLLATMLGCGYDTLPTTYLGLPLGAPYNSIKIWDGVFERLEKRLSTWKSNYLSKGGKVTLIKSTLMSIPVYFLSLFTLPRSVEIRMERLMRNFLWNDRNGMRKYHLVKWKIVCMPKKSGGLGIRGLRLANRALLGKWLWRFGEERSSLWRKVIKAKYGEKRLGWYSGVSRDSYGCSVWKGILKGSEDFEGGIRFKAGSGDRIRFWEDSWCGTSPLATQFPSLYTCSIKKNRSIQQCLVRNESGPTWDLGFRRNFNDWELTQVTSLLDLLHTSNLNDNEQDKWEWTRAKDLRFSVRSFFKWLSFEAERPLLGSITWSRFSVMAGDTIMNLPNGDKNMHPEPQRTYQVVVAATQSMGIGKDGKLPWRLPSDLKFFKEVTITTSDPLKKNAVIMGRKTWESIPLEYRPLPGRLNVVLTRSTSSDIATADNVVICRSMVSALELLAASPYCLLIEKVFLIGGGQIFREALNASGCEAIHITEIEANIECDTFMPPIDSALFQPWYSSFPLVENGIQHSFVTYVRVRNSMEESDAFDNGVMFDGNSDSSKFEIQKFSFLPKMIFEKHEEYAYLRLVQDIISNGTQKDDRTGTGTLSKFGCQMRFNLRKSFPILTTKKVFWRGVVEELLWFISGSTNAKVLQEKGIHIWDGNASRDYLDSIGLTDREEGDLGPIYGFQWRHFGARYTDMHADYTGQGFDQLLDVIDKLKNKPEDRRIVLSAWNPSDLKSMALPPCHMFAQFYVANGELSCQMYQRSADMGLGVPFNIASYSLLTCMIAHVCDLVPGDFVHVVGDAHVYRTHVRPLQEQLRKLPKPFPILKINPQKKDIDSFVMSDFKLIGYDPHQKIEMKMAV